MREHVQVRVGSGTERPIVQRFDATTSDFLLGFGTVFEFAATEFSPGTIVFRVPLREFLNRNAFPIAEAAFTHADVGMHFQAQRVGERMRGGCGTPQIGTDDQPVRNIGTTITYSSRNGVGRLANLPLSDFVDGECRSGLADVAALVGGTSVTHQRDGVHMFRYCAVMLKFDVSRHAAALRCFLDYGMFAKTASLDMKTCLPHLYGKACSYVLFRGFRGLFVGSLRMFELQVDARATFHKRSRR